MTNQIIISAGYYGCAIRSSRDKYKISARTMTHLLGCGAEQLHRYEAGCDLIPRDVLRRVFTYAAMMDKMTMDDDIVQ